MIKTINKTDFIDAFKKMDRAVRFSYNGLIELFDYLESAETEEEPLELDVIAICCDFCEYDNVKEYNKYNGTEYKDIYDINDVVCSGYDEDKFIVFNT